MIIPIEPDWRIGSLVAAPLVADKIRNIATDQAEGLRLEALERASRELAGVVVDLEGLGVDPSAVREAKARLDDRVLSVPESTSRVAGSENEGSAVPGPAAGTNLADLDQQETRRLPLSVDALQLDAQYFSNVMPKTWDPAGAIRDMILRGTTLLPPQVSQAVAELALSEVRSPKDGGATGTLVMVACCTHGLADIACPLVLDPERTLAAWNMLHPADSISETGTSEQAPGESKNALWVVSGLSFGSAFVGMLHTSGHQGRFSEPTREVAAEAKRLIDQELARRFRRGQFGLSETSSSEVKRILPILRGGRGAIVSVGVTPTVTLKVDEHAPATVDAMFDSLEDFLGAVAVRKSGQGLPIGCLVSEKRKEDVLRLIAHAQATLGGTDGPTHFVSKHDPPPVAGDDDSSPGIVPGD